VDVVAVVLGVLVGDGGFLVEDHADAEIFVWLWALCGKAWGGRTGGRLVLGLSLRAF
jgi:hypothetical protein